MIFLKTFTVMSTVFGLQSLSQSEIIIPGTMQDCNNYLQRFVEDIPDKEQYWTVDWSKPNSVRLTMKDGPTIALSKSCIEVK